MKLRIPANYLRKGLNPKYAQNGDIRLNSAHFIIFRYAEVLLSYAEAQNEASGRIILYMKQLIK